MKPTNLRRLSSANLDTGTRVIQTSSRGLFLRLGLILILGGLLVSSFYSSSSASQSSQISKKEISAVALHETSATPGSLRLADRVLPAPGESFNPVLMPFPPVGTTIDTFATDCTTPKSSFVVTDTVCIKVSGFPVGSLFPHRLILGNANSTVIQSFDITSDPQSFSFVVDATTNIGGNIIDNRGTWQAVVVNPFFYYPEGSSLFTVADPANFTADTGVSTTQSPGGVQAGTAITFKLQLKNYGPDSAATVELTDAVPANTTFVNFQQVSGPTFTCNSPTVGSTGTTTCTIASLAWPGPAAEFVATYQVIAGTAVNTLIVNTANLSSTTNDQNVRNGSTSATATVINGSGGNNCSFDCPANITVAATSADGAVVTFASAVNISGTCGAISAIPSSGSLFPVGTTVVTVSSDAGPSCSFTVTVSDTAAPTISCPPDQTVPAGPAGRATVNPGVPTTTPTMGVTVSAARDDGVESLTETYPTGSTHITWTVTDSAGRSASCTQAIVVTACANDTSPPTITAPADLTVGTGAGSTTCAAVLDDELGSPIATDDCSVTITSSGIPAGNLFPVGMTTITYTATDGAGHTASAVQHVTVTDDTPPIIVAPADASYSCPGDVPAANPSQAHGTDPNLTDGGPPTDNCGSPTVTVSQSSSGVGSAANPLIITRTYTATDSNGNSANSVQIITVTDATAPTITAPANVTAYTGAGATSCDTVVSNATLGTASALDNCAGVAVSRSPSGNTFPVGSTTVTWTATDWAGNTATANQTVTVIDNTLPVVTPPAAITLNTGSGASSCSVTVSNLDGTLGTGSATDNCPGVGAVTRSGVPAGNIFPVGNTTLTYSATDAHGNTGSATQVVTVVDNTVPVISCPASITLEPTCPSGAIATYATPTATDNCGVQSVTRTAGLASGSVFPIGTSTVTYTATDVHGNTASCSFTVTVKTAAQTVQAMIAAVQALQPPLSGTQAQGLQSKLQAALDAINQGKQNVACNKLADFINQVSAFLGNGTLTSAQGQPLINSANKVRNTIGCTNNPCT